MMHDPWSSRDERGAHHSRAAATSRAVHARGAVLMEVVIGLAIFAVVAAFVLDALNSSLRAVHRAEVDAEAADLAVTVTSFVQLGAVAMTSDGPWAFDEPIDPAWTWEIVVNDLTDNAQQLTKLKQVEIIIRNSDKNTTYRVTHLMRERVTEEETQTPEESGTTPQIPASSTTASGGVSTGAAVPPGGGR